jgi:hypothetical protein
VGEILAKLQMLQQQGQQKWINECTIWLHE